MKTPTSVSKLNHNQLVSEAEDASVSLILSPLSGSVLSYALKHFNTKKKQVQQLKLRSGGFG